MTGASRRALQRRRAGRFSGQQMSYFFCAPHRRLAVATTASMPVKRPARGGGGAVERQSKTLCQLPRGDRPLAAVRNELAAQRGLRGHKSPGANTRAATGASPTTGTFSTRHAG